MQQISGERLQDHWSSGCFCYTTVNSQHNIAIYFFAPKTVLFWDLCDLLFFFFFFFFFSFLCKVYLLMIVILFYYCILHIKLYLYFETMLILYLYLQKLKVCLSYSHTVTFRGLRFTTFLKRSNTAIYVVKRITT